MFYNALSFLVRNLAGFLILNLLLRFYLQVARVSFGHPLAQFTVKLTNFMVLPVRRLVPSVHGYDTATMILAWVTALVMNILLILLSPFPISLLRSSSALGLAMMSVLTLIQFSLYLMLGAVLVQAILSWVNPYNPIAPLLDALTRPFLNPIRTIIPPIGGVDLSPLVLLLAMQMLLQFIVTPLGDRILQYAVSAM